MCVFTAVIYQICARNKYEQTDMTETLPKAFYGEKSVRFFYVFNWIAYIVKNVMEIT